MDHPPSTDDRIADVWRAEHRHLLDIAFRMLGDLREAEDAVQEAFIRLVRSGLDGVDDARGWLTVVVGRICIDMMRSARVRPPASGGADPSESAATTPDPADRITLDDAVRTALLVVLERLTPAERTAFVLHDVFQLDFETVGTIVGRSAAASRQLASRARRHVSADAGRDWAPVAPAEHRRVTEGFITACSGGDLQGLLALLDPDVAGDGSPGGWVPAFKPITGAERVAPNLLRLFGPASGFTLVSTQLRGQPAVVASRDRQVAAVLLFELQGDRIHHIHAVGDPAALR
jgi:RNA polymerase sigma-70 factor (ECF subfamily)